MNLIRTFHPIGQGAFYSERHFFGTEEFTIVYDCGSSTFGEKKIEKKIRSTFAKGHKINILFISHFDNDHISGLKILINHCKIEKVIMPLISEESKILVKVVSSIGNTPIDYRLIDNPSTFFKEYTKIISIREVETSDNNNGISLNNRRNIENIDISQEINSGTIFNTSNNIHWLFIPFNYKFKDKCISFKAELGKVGLTLDQIDTIEKIQVNLAKIKRAYKNVDYNLNEHSLVLYSGKLVTNNLSCIENYHHYHHFPFCFRNRESGCLYLGDINLNQPNVVVDIKNKLRVLLPHIGTIQVPHHGSIENFNESILTPNLSCAVFSYGTTNSYGHPSDRVIGEIVSNYICAHFVTEQQQSIIIQYN